MKILYRDRDIAVCLKPPGILSTDEPGGLPELLRSELSAERVLSVHRLDRAASGLMVYALRSKAASELSRQLREGEFHKSYLAVVRGEAEDGGELCDLLWHDRAARKTLVVMAPGQDVKEARLRYRCLERREGLSLLRIELLTGRTHQIRCQFAARGLPLVGERKYAEPRDELPLALWSTELRFLQPYSREPLSFTAQPPEEEPWGRMKTLR